MPKRDALYFAGTEQLSDIGYQNVRTAAKEFGALGPLAKHGQTPTGRRANGTRTQADRVIFYSLKPSRHKCDARCMNARGHNCECSCGGANHGINR